MTQKIGTIDVDVAEGMREMASHADLEVLIVEEILDCVIQMPSVSLMWILLSVCATRVTEVTALHVPV